MSKPIAYAATALRVALSNHGHEVSHTEARSLAEVAVREFLADAKSEGRFDNEAIRALLADI